jgi:NADH:flavin oxidoreductases, Old Yellow Enzyme family
MSHPLFSPLRLRSLELRNRIGVSPMCQYSYQDGFSNDWQLVHLGSRAQGGAGLVIVEATAVLPEGRITPGDLGIWKDEHIPGLKRVVDFVHSQGAHIGIQLAHAGRKASMALPWAEEKLVPVEEGGWLPVAPSELAFAPNYGLPRALDQTGIDEVIEAYRLAARRALKAGFDLVEIHAAHGYLMHEFYSPLSNYRRDDYGGSFENRTRLVLQIADAVRSEWPDHLPVFTRISSTDWVEGGWTLDESVELARLLKTHGIDLVDVSSGGNIPSAKILVGPGYQVPFAARIRNEAGVATAAVGMITDAKQANEIVTNGEADMVLLAREMLRDPYWAVHAAAELENTASWPRQYIRAAPRGSVEREPLVDH